jgi:hypothetical protein
VTIALTFTLKREIMSYLFLENKDGQLCWTDAGILSLRKLPMYIEKDESEGLALAHQFIESLLLDKGFEKVGDCKFKLKDRVEVCFFAGSVEVIREGKLYGERMYFIHGAKQLCDLWNNIRDAWFKLR